MCCNEFVSKKIFVATGIWVFDLGLFIVHYAKEGRADNSFKLPAPLVFSAFCLFLRLSNVPAFQRLLGV
jgi:hypothetical protein